MQNKLNEEALKTVTDGTFPWSMIKSPVCRDARATFIHFFFAKNLFLRSFSIASLYSCKLIVSLQPSL